MTTLRETLPPIYRPLVDALFDRPRVDEKRATCERCAMCDHGDPAPVPMEYFRPDTKCCTYFPQLPNYLVGAILADASPEMAVGKERVRARIASRIGVTPRGVTRPRKTDLLLRVYHEAFGRAESLRCPYFDATNPSASCTIWRHREAVCQTYFCKYQDGQRGFDFWTALKYYLGYVEQTLSHFAAEAVDAGVVEPTFKRNALSPEDIDDLPPRPAEYARWWGAWVAREEEFYRRCHVWVQGTNAAQFQKNVESTSRGRELTGNLRAAYEKLAARTLPTNLVRNARMKEDHAGGKVVVTTYHRYDAFALDEDLYEVLGELRAGETLDQNLVRLRTGGIELPKELVEVLFAAGVLIEPSVESRSGPEASPEVVSARRAALLAVLDARRFDVDGEAEERITAADAVTLQRWIERAAVATTLDEVLGR